MDSGYLYERWARKTAGFCITMRLKKLSAWVAETKRPETKRRSIAAVVTRARGKNPA